MPAFTLLALTAIMRYRSWAHHNYQVNLFVESPIMLTEWTIGNFKSFSGITTLPLAPITILAGANSSGKSSIIQSILLIKQTLQYAPVSRPIGLNGPLLKLGRFDDIRNVSSEAAGISLGWVLDDLQSYRFPLGGIRGQRLNYLGESSPIKATMELTFSSLVDSQPEKRSSQNAELAQLQPTLTALSLKVDVNREGKSRTANVSLVKGHAAKLPEDGFVNNYTTLFPYLIKRMDSDTRASITEHAPEGVIVGADMRHFFPFNFGYTYNQRRFFSQKMTESLFAPSIHRRYFDSKMAAYVLKPATVNFLIDLLGSFVATDGDGLVSNLTSSETVDFEVLKRHIGRFQERVRDKEMTANEFQLRFDHAIRYNPVARRSMRNLFVEHQDEIEQKFYTAASDLSEKGFDSGFSHDMNNASEYIQNFFQSSIHYLGPLRDEPRPIYPLEALINPRDVGYRGEHTAAVLDLHRETKVECFKSSDASMLIGAEKVQVPLLSAVQDWLSYLGVAEAVNTTDLGKIGHQLQVSIDKGAKAHDLTNVGVGVSQLLPLVVMSLLANSPSLLIFEQPELHLHPKVQARLADFFFSLSLLGKQCLLETHSEYLVERFRLRIAQAPGEALNEKVRIYFTQKVDNKTVCREVKLTKYGAIIDWPDDFFDQAENETEAILRAAQAKRRSEREDLRDGGKK